jgi:hypothetical protein
MLARPLLASGRLVAVKYHFFTIRMRDEVSVASRPKALC